MKFLGILVFTFLFFVSDFAFSAVHPSSIKDLKELAQELQKERVSKFRKLQRGAASKRKPVKGKKKSEIKKKPNQGAKINYKPRFTSKKKSKKVKPFFDIPVTYNNKVKSWISYYQNNGKNWFKKRIERSYKYLPNMKWVLKDRGLPQDLAYIAMIESGFSPHAESHAEAVGYWQFIEPTAKRYGLKVDWWIDERRDHMKSTKAAANYLGDLYKMFNSWYLTASAYNMGENRLKRLIKKHKTKNFWILSEKRDFPEETRNYIPKLLAALMISKAPGLYGFKNIEPHPPMAYDYIFVPGGTDLFNMASFLQVRTKKLKKLNPELLQGFVPGFIRNHRIRIPKGYSRKVASYIRTQL